MKTTIEQAKAFHSMNGIENTKQNVKNTRKLLDLLKVDSDIEEFLKEDIKPLSERSDLIIKKWTSKKGVEHITYKNNDSEFDIQPHHVYIYVVLPNNRIVHNGSIGTYYKTK